MDDSIDIKRDNRKDVPADVQYGPPGKVLSLSQSLEGTLGFPVTDLSASLSGKVNKDADWLIRLLQTAERSHQIREDKVRAEERLSHTTALYNSLLRTRISLDLLPPIGAILIGLVTFLWQESQKTIGAGLACGCVVVLGLALTLAPATILKKLGSSENKQ